MPLRTLALDLGLPSAPAPLPREIAWELAELRARLDRLLPQVPPPELPEARSDLWGTPDDIYADLSARYGPYTLDVAAEAANAKCPRFFDRHANGLVQPWRGEMVWCNCPYSTPHLEAFASKLRLEVLAREAVGGTLFIPATSDGTLWWRELIRRRGVAIVAQWDCQVGGHDTAAVRLTDGPLTIEILMLYGRVRFVAPDGATRGTGRFASAAITFLSRTG